MPGSECCAYSRCCMTFLPSCGRHLSDPAQAVVDAVKLPRALAHRFNAEVRI